MSTSRMQNSICFASLSPYGPLTLSNALKNGIKWTSNQWRPLNGEENAAVGQQEPCAGAECSVERERNAHQNTGRSTRIRAGRETYSGCRDLESRQEES